MKKAQLLLSFMLLLALSNSHPLQAQQNGCSNITYNVLYIGSCHYRLLVNNSSECYPEIRLLLDIGSFQNWHAQTQTGWSGEELTPTEILLTHSSGLVPLGASTPIDFYVPEGINPTLTILWDYICPLGKGCIAEFPLESCAIVADACISGVVYVDVSCAALPYSNQPLLAGWTVTLLDAMGNTQDSMVTGANGAYSFCDLPAGNYIVKLTNKLGWTPKLPVSGQYIVNLAQSGQVVKNFGNCRVACLCSSVVTTVQQISTSPTACCYSLSTQVQDNGAYCFQYINIQVDAGQTITPSFVQTGWTVNQINTQYLQIIPPNGFIPYGNFTPLTFCVSGGTTHSIFVSPGYSDSAGAHECDQVLTFSCPNCTCPPPTGLAVSDIDGTSATISWIPATCSESTWVYVEDGFNAAEHISRPTPIDSFVLDNLVPGRIYQLYAFSLCNGMMSESSDTIRYINPCYGMCSGNLLSNGSFSVPYVQYPTVPNATDQIGLCPGWQAAANGSNASGTGEWFMNGPSFFFPQPFPGSYFDATNNQYVLLTPLCDPWHAGFDLNTCEGISTQLTSPVVQGSGYSIGFWWALREPVTSNFTFLAILSGGPCTMNTANGGTACTHQCNGDFHIPINVTTADKPGEWHLQLYTATAPMTVNHLTFAANSSGAIVNNYVYIDEICMYNVWLPCTVDNPRITYNPEQPNAFLGEAEAGPGSNIISAVWDFGDGTRDSSCCVGSVIHDFAPGSYEVCLTVTAADTSGATCSKTACIPVVITQSGDKCDDIAAFLQSSGVGDCCYILNTSNLASNCFTQIDVTLSSGNFVNSQFGAGWNIGLNGSMASLTPNNIGGFIPTGNDIPITICDPAGTEPYTVDVDFVYNAGVCHQSFDFSCDPALCMCQGFQNMSFNNLPNQPDLQVDCSNQPSLILPCIASDGLYNFQGYFFCQGNCVPTVNYEIFHLNGPSVLSGTTNSSYFFISGFKFAPGDYKIELYGICGDTCTCNIYFTIPDCGTCCSDFNAFCQTVDNATNIILDPVNCKATLDISSLACNRIEWIDWGEGPVVNGPFYGGSMPMHNYSNSGNYTITYLAVEVNPQNGQVCFQKIFTETIDLECIIDCHCGTWSNTSYRFGGALNQPISCGETVTIPATAPLAVYTDFLCQGNFCPPNPGIDWSLTGPPSFNTQASSSFPTGTSPNYSIFIPGGSFALPGTYTLTMQAYCGYDTCICVLHFDSEGTCCMDYDGFCNLVNQGFSVQNDGCNVVVTAPQFGVCNALDATLDWGDGTPLVSGTVPAGTTWSHSYNAITNHTYNICATVYESTCWSKQMCTPVTINCLESCEQNAVQNGNFSQGLPNGSDESIGLANHWGSIWPANFGQSTGDFYNASAVPSSVLTPPLPASQGNFGGFWCAIQPNLPNYREGIMNELASTLTVSGIGQYDLSFKMACMSTIHGAPSLSVYGVFAPGLASGTVPTSQTAPVNTGLFPPGTAVEIVTLPIPSSCDENYILYNFTINASQFPAQGISHLFFTRSDNFSGDVYLAIDDVCLTPVLSGCCASQPGFDLVIDSQVVFNTDVGDCSVNIQTGNLPDCDAVTTINWGDGDISTGPFAANVTVEHTYAESGTYTVSFTATETDSNGQTCFQTSRTQEVTPVCNITCPCLGYSNLIFNPGQSGGPQSVTCGTDVILPCQDGTIYTLSGILNCASIGGCSASPLNWQLFGPQGLVDAGTTAVNPGFSISLPSGYFYLAGTYTLMFNALCNGNPCACVIYFVVDTPCPALCPCDVDDFQADVLAGFTTTQYSIFSCKACFKGKALGPCDMVEWSVDNGPFSAPIPGTQQYCFNFSGNSSHFIEMRVTRKKGVNLICESFVFNKTITVNCIPVADTHRKRNFTTPGHPFAPITETARNSVNTSNLLEKTALRIFPNPNSGAFSVELPEPAGEGMGFHITDLTGRVILEQDIQTGEKLQTIDAGDLPGGLYFLQVVSGGKIVVTEKFVKQ